VKRRLTPALLAIAVALNCTQSRRMGPRPQGPDPANMVPARARTIYREMGLMIDTARMPLVASLRFLPGSTPESTVAIFGLSLANRVLNFRRDENGGLVAGYHVELTLRQDTAVVRQVVRDETVRVGTQPETLRRDESIVFQQILTVPSGVYTVGLVVRDRSSPAYAETKVVDTVPRIETPGLSTPLLIYQGAGRARRGTLPQLVMNPRAATPFDTDTARWYVEAYELPRGTRIAARVVDLDSVELWRDTLTLGEGPLATLRFGIKPGVLPPGRAEFQVQAVGGTARATAPFLVAFSDLWAVHRFDETVDVLRYFARQAAITKLKAAPRTGRAAAWQAFYAATDSAPRTPRHEPLERYFRRVDVANQRYADPGAPGWKTDRGEVFITLGEPDQAFEVPGRTAPGIRWEYSDLHVTLAFQDDDGWGKYHLTLQSRAEYERVLAQVRGAP